MSFNSDNPNLKILCVDDEPLNLEILEELLENDFNLHMVESAEACLQCVAQCQPDLILLDVNMPGMSGIEACQILKENPDTSIIPIIFVSALGRKIEMEAGLSAGGDVYITKPFEIDEVMAIIESVLDTKD